jgi:hypothetical protein
MPVLKPYRRTVRQFVSPTGMALRQPRAALAEARLFDFKTMLDDIREQRDRWQQQAERLAALAITDQRTASVMAATAASLNAIGNGRAWNGCGDISRCDPDRGLDCCRGAGA